MSTPRTLAVTALLLVGASLLWVALSPLHGQPTQKCPVCPKRRPPGAATSPPPPPTPLVVDIPAHGDTHPTSQPAPSGQSAPDSRRTWSQWDAEWAPLSSGIPREIPPDTVQCIHASPQIGEAISQYDVRDPKKRDLCSFWGDGGPYGDIPAHRRSNQIGVVPPRALCYSQKVCFETLESLCTAHPNNIEENPIQFCPHHDGPLRLSLRQCTHNTAAFPTLSTCDKLPGERRAQGLGHGRNYLMIGVGHLIDGLNVWHFFQNYMNVFGLIVQSDPQLLSDDNTFTKSDGRLLVTTLPDGYYGSLKYDKINPAYRFGPERGREVLQLLQSLVSCKVETPVPEEPHCYENAVMGLPTEVFLQWEDQPITPTMRRYSYAFAKHVVSVFTSHLKQIHYSAAFAAVDKPWNRVYKERERPLLLVMARGEGQVVNKDRKPTRQIRGMDELIDGATWVGFDVNVVRGASMTLSTQVRIAAEGDVLAGVHGAALAWALFLPRWGVLMELRPTLHLTDRTFIYPNLAAVRQLSFVEWHQTESVEPAADRRLPFNTDFVVTSDSARYHCTLCMRKLIKARPQFAKTAAWFPQSHGHAA
eukprot:Rhum_TRINITY_DN16545_c0_g1::Rhum_TRINITY_DN16545_c0_g1_i1::g.163498::m.163498